MRALAGNAERGPVLATALIAASLAVLAAGETQVFPMRIAVPLLAAAVVLTAWHSTILRWRSLLVGIVAVILFIPIRRYSMPGNLPFALEPYRLLVGFVAFAWLTSMLIDPRVKFRRTGLEAPLGLFVVSALGSNLVNPGRSASLMTEVVKKFTFFVSFLIVLYLVRSVVKTRVDLDFLLKFFVGGGAVLAILTIIQDRTRFNVFDHLQGVVPLLHFNGLAYDDAHGSRVRAYASAQHAIALGAGLVMLVPLAVYLVKRTGQHRWRAALIIILLGTLATRSRTSIVMLVVLALVYVILRPHEMKRLWPLIIPFLLAAHIALPGVFGTFQSAFFPKGGLVAQQKSGAGTYGSGRIADLGPGLSELGRHPILGEGFGTRITDRGSGMANAPILDDQWLGTLLETGVVGAAAWVWLFVRMTRRLGRAAKRDRSPHGWLLAGLAGAVVSYAAGMCFYDSFSFIQEVFILFILLGVGSAALALQPAGQRARRQRATAPVLVHN